MNSKILDGNACDARPCLNGAACTPVGNSYSCACLSGYTGTICQIFNACFNNPCRNGGTCSANGNSYVCSCPQFYSGTNCDTCNFSFEYLKIP